MTRLCVILGVTLMLFGCATTNSSQSPDLSHYQTKQLPSDSNKAAETAARM